MKQKLEFFFKKGKKYQEKTEKKEKEKDLFLREF
jgi:hypothetical protein